MRQSKKSYNLALQKIENILGKSEEHKKRLDFILPLLKINSHIKKIDCKKDILLLKDLPIKTPFSVAIISASFDYSFTDTLEAYYADVIINILLFMEAEKKLKNYQWYLPDDKDLPLALNKVINDLLAKPIYVDEKTYLMKPIKSLSYLLEEKNGISENICDRCLKPCEYSENIKISIDEILFDCKSNSPILLHPKDVAFACSGRGTCGKCKVLTNNLTEPNEREKAKLTEEEILKGIRLMCQLKAVKGLKITTFKQNDFQIASNFDLSNWQVEPNYLDGYGLAIDIGTTTIVIILINLKDFSVVKEIMSVNVLQKYGHDILTRISYMLTNKDISLANELVIQIKDLIFNNVFYFIPKITKTVVTGNTIMLHIFSDLDLKSLIYHPFNNQLKEDLIFENNKILNIPGKLIIPRSLSTYIGNDITLGIVATEDINKMKDSIYLDLGTNGEIVFCKDNFFYCAATALGPALEGANISCGMGAFSGAICRYEEGKIVTINNKKPLGICGSGIIDVISHLLKRKKLDLTGLLKEKTFHLTEDIFLNQEDIRAVQLTKSAIITHIKMLTENDYTKIQKFYIAGGFGKFLDLKNAISINLLPDISLDKFVVIGNASLKGALSVLRTTKTLKLHEKLLNKAIEVKLQENSQFFEKFIENIDFRE